MNMQPPPSLPQNTEDQLVKLARQEDAAAFTALLDRFLPAIRARASRYSSIVGVDTDDFVQEGMLALYRAVKSYDPDSGVRFSTYANTCINNSMTSSIKKHLKSIHQDSSIAIENLDEKRLHVTVTGTDLVEDSYIDQEATNLRFRQIETLLSDFERQVLQLYLSEHSYRQIAKVLSTSTKAVDNALQRVRRKLRPEI